MRVSSALGSSRGEADRMRAEQDPLSPMKEDAERASTHDDAQEFTRVPSDRARRLAENLSLLSEGADTARPVSRKQTAESQHPMQLNEVGEMLPQRPVSRKTEDKASRIESVPTFHGKGHDSASKEGKTAVERRSQPSKESKSETKDKPASSLAHTSTSGDVPAPAASTKRSVGASVSKAAGAHKNVPAASSATSGPGSRSSVPVQRHRSAPRPNETGSAPHRPVTKETSRDRVAKEPSRLSTARSNISTTSSTSVHPNYPTASRGMQARRRFSTAPSGNTPRNDRPSTMTTSKGEVAAERSKPDAGDKSARPGTSVVEVNNMKILVHALGVNPKLKNSPLARTARFGLASKNKARPTSPRPQERATTAASVAVSKDSEAPDSMKKRPPWNPSTLDTLYSPRKPDASPPKSRDASPHKVQREESRGRDLGQAPARSARAERSSPSASQAKNHTARSPPRGRAGSKASGRGDQALPASSASTAAAPTKSDGEDLIAPEVKTGVNDESTSSLVDNFDVSVPAGGWRGEGKVEGEGVEPGGEGARQVNQPCGNEFLIPPEFQNLDRPVTRRDERPNTRRDDRPGTRSGMDDRPATRGLEDRPTTRGHDGRRSTRSLTLHRFPVFSPCALHQQYAQDPTKHLHRTLCTLNSATRALAP